VSLCIPSIYWSAYLLYRSLTFSSTNKSSHGKKFNRKRSYSSLTFCYQLFSYHGKIRYTRINFNNRGEVNELEEGVEYARYRCRRRLLYQIKVRRHACPARKSTKTCQR